MAQNYETARSNPEIHLLPGNLKDARDAVFPSFWGTDSWSSPLHLENVKGPANYTSLVGALACLLKNPNLCTDTYSQRSNELEVKSVTALANLLFYHTRDPWGVFTMGGTISNLYGARIGIEKVLPGAMQQGLGAAKLAGIVSAAAHYGNRSVAGWPGLGTANQHAVPTDAKLAMRLDLLGETLDRLYAEGTRVAFVTATFGTTDASGVDDIACIRAVIEDRAAAHGMPVPQLHVDAAVGWALSFLTAYDLPANPLDFSAELLEQVRRARAHALGLRQADSIMLPKGRNAKEIFARLEAGELPPQKFAGYAAEIRRLFDKRQESMDPARDARLSFTTGIGYRPHGIDLPAWKAVLFNPRADEAIIDRLAAGSARMV